MQNIKNFILQINENNNYPHQIFWFKIYNKHDFYTGVFQGILAYTTIVVEYLIRKESFSTLGNVLI